MVVISIVGLLAGITMVSVRSARINARDAVRKRDVQIIEKALVMYWEKTGQFPSEATFDGSIGSDGCGCPASGAPAGCTGKDWCRTSGIWAGIVTNQKILGALPVDPANTTAYYYSYEPCCNQACGSSGTTCVGKGCCEYTITASRLESTGTSYSRTARWEQ